MQYLDFNKAFVLTGTGKRGKLMELLKGWYGLSQENLSSY